MLQMQKQLRAATATMFLLGWQSPARTLRVQSILAMGGLLPGSMALATVVFLKLSSNWVLAPSVSMRWKALLQLPVKKVFPSGEQEIANLSKIQSFSNISQSLPLRPSCTMKLLTGFLELQMSQTLTVRKSRVIRYLPFGVNSPEEQQEIISVRKFFCPGSQFLKLIAVLSVLAEMRMSHNLRVPLLVPQAKRLSVAGCMRLKLIFSLMSSIFSPFSKSATRKGCSGFQKLHRKACTSSEESIYCWLQTGTTEFMAERCLGLKATCIWEMQEVSTPCNLGMESSLPADLTTFLSVFSKTFHSLIVRSLVVSSLRQAPCGASQAISRTSSSISMLRRGSNSLVCDWNSEKYSQSSRRLLLSGQSKTMTLPALSPSANFLPVLSKRMTEMMSSSMIFSLGPLQPKSWPNLQLAPLLELAFYIFLLSLYSINSSEIMNNLSQNLSPPHPHPLQQVVTSSWP